MLRTLAYILIFTTFVIFSWIGLNVYHSSTMSTISKDTNMRIVPITPSFKKDVINKLQSRKNVKADLSQKISNNTTPTIPIASQSPTIKQSTTSGSLNGNQSSSSQQSL